MYDPYSVDLHLAIIKDDKIISSCKKQIRVEPLGKIVEEMNIALPEDSVDYYLVAELTYNDEFIKSSREITTK